MKTALAKWATVSTKSLHSLVGGSTGSESQIGGPRSASVSPARAVPDDADLLSDMDARFYQPDFDCIESVLGQLAADCSDRDLEQSLQTYDNFLCLIKAQLSSQIFANYNEFSIFVIKPICFYCLLTDPYQSASWRGFTISSPT